MTSGFRVRSAQTGDAPEVAAFTAGTFAWGDYIADIFDAWLTEPDGALLVAEADVSGRVVGVMHACVSNSGEGWLEGLRVHPAFRRQGVGDALNRAGRAWIASRGAGIAHLAVDEANAAARSQVARLGFEAVAAFVHGEAPSAGDNGSEIGAAGEVGLALASDAPFVLRLWADSALRQATGGLMAHRWRWWTAAPADVATAIRRFQVLVHPQGCAVVDLVPEPAELRWLEPAGRGRLAPAEVARLLASGTRQSAVAVGRRQVRALLPVSDDIVEGIAAAGFALETRLGVYSALV